MPEHSFPAVPSSEAYRSRCCGWGDEQGYKESGEGVRQMAVRSRRARVRQDVQLAPPWSSGCDRRTGATPHQKRSRLLWGSQASDSPPSRSAVSANTASLADSPACHPHQCDVSNILCRFQPVFVAPLCCGGGTPQCQLTVCTGLSAK